MSYNNITINEKPMKNLILRSLKNKLVVFIFVLAFAAGLSLISGQAARADGGSDGSVVVGGVTYHVEHNGEGPVVDIKGMEIPVQGHDNDRFIIWNGKRFDVMGDGHHDNGDENHNDHRDHKDNGDHHDNKDHKDHKDNHDHGDHKDSKDHGDHKDHSDNHKD